MIASEAQTAWGYSLEDTWTCAVTCHPSARQHNQSSGITTLNEVPLRMGVLKFSYVKLQGLTQVDVIRTILTPGLS